MSKTDKKKVAGQIEEAVKKYNEIKSNTEKEIEKIQQQLLEIGVSGSTIVKMEPNWHHDVNFLLKKAAANPDQELFKKAG